MINRNIKIINYNDITKLREDECLFESIKNADIHICASLVNSIAMNFEYGKDFKNNSIISMSHFIGGITGSWDNRDTKLVQRIKLNNEIKLLEDGFTLTGDEKYRELVSTIRGNREDMLSSIRLLVECNIFPEDIEQKINNLSDEMKVFLTIWKRLELVDEEILMFRNMMYRLLEDKDTLEEKMIFAINIAKEKQIESLKKYFIDKSNLNHFINKKIELKNRCSENDENVKYIEKEINILNEKIEYIKHIVKKDYTMNSTESLPKTIVLQGFYFITPIQERIISLINETFDKVEIIFLNNYNENYKDIFDIWDKSFSRTFYPIINSEDIVHINKTYKWSDVFAEVYKGNTKNINSIIKNIDSKIQKPVINEYENMITFQDENNFENTDENINLVYYSPESEQLNGILDDVFPRKTKKHILSRPIGQLIRILYNIWNDSDSTDLKINIDTLESCIATGWITIIRDGKEENAMEYLHKLRKIRAYFIDCTVLSDWKNKFEIWGQGKNFIENDLGIRNILWNFSFWDITEEDMETIKLILETVKEMALLLNNSDENEKYNDQATISEHFKNIQILINKIVESAKEEIEDEEDKKVIDALVKVLETKKNDITCLSDDVIEALSEYLNTENIEFEGIDARILDIKDIDSSSILNKYRNVNLCQLTSEFIPDLKSRYTWPLTKNFIDSLIQNIVDGDELLELRLNRLRLIIEERKSRNKYLLFNALESSSNINISLIKNVNNEEYRESIYINILKDVGNLTVKSDENMKYDFTRNNVVLKSSNYNFEESKNYFNEKVIHTRLRKEKIDRTTIKSHRNNRIEEFKKNNSKIQLHRILINCPKRHSYYNNLIHLSYTDDFHHKKLFSRLIQIIYESCTRDNNLRTKLSQKEIRNPKGDKVGVEDNFHNILDNIGMFFPQWTLIEKISLVNDAINNKGYDYDYNDDIVELIKDKGTSDNHKFPIIIPNPLKIYADNIDDNYNEDSNYHFTVKHLHIGKWEKRIAQIDNMNCETCKWCNCIDLCKDSTYSVDLKNSTNITKGKA